MSEKHSQDSVKPIKKRGGENASSDSFEKIKVVIAFVILLLGIVGYYHYAVINHLLAFVSLGMGGFLFLLIFFFSKMGRDFIVFFKEARMELRKVVWPTMDETKKMTMIVLFVMALVLVYLLIADSVLSGLLKYILSKV